MSALASALARSTASLDLNSTKPSMLLNRDEGGLLTGFLAQWLASHGVTSAQHAQQIPAYIVGQPLAEMAMAFGGSSYT